MTVFGATVAAIVRKANAFLTECRRCRSLVATVKAQEVKIVTTAKTEVNDELAAAKRRVELIELKAKYEVDTLRNDLIEQIAKL